MAKLTEELRKHTLNLFEGDYARLQDRYPEIGAGMIIRLLVRKHLDAVNPESIEIKELKL